MAEAAVKLEAEEAYVEKDPEYPVKVFILWGEKAADWAWNVRRREVEDLEYVIGKIRIYEFQTEEEADAFREGLCMEDPEWGGEDADEILARRGVTELRPQTVDMLKGLLKDARKARQLREARQRASCA